MSVIEVDSGLLDEIRTFDGMENSSLTAVVEEALCRHLSRLRQQKIDKERRYYETCHSVLVQSYLGQYVAIHEEAVVGSGPDGHELARQMRQKYGRILIAIIRIEEPPEPPTIRVRSPKLVRIQQPD
jgi:hypothetical protein